MSIPIYGCIFCDQYRNFFKLTPFSIMVLIMTIINKEEAEISLPKMEWLGGVSVNAGYYPFV
ncbi:hypothetical protein EDI29_03060 [Pectobacterium polonicum]|nr:hypothetical protein EDI29_03060 [Pectobacterium polonicum]